MTVADIRRHEPPQAPSACPGTGLTPSIDKTSRALKQLAGDFGRISSGRLSRCKTLPIISSLALNQRGPQTSCSDFDTFFLIIFFGGPEVRRFVIMVFCSTRHRQGPSLLHNSIGFSPAPTVSLENFDGCMRLV